jgi:hypothetical protein
MGQREGPLVVPAGLVMGCGGWLVHLAALCASSRSSSGLFLHRGVALIIGIYVKCPSQSLRPFGPPRSARCSAGSTTVALCVV